MKLLNQVRELCRVRHFSLRAEGAYVHWIVRSIHFHNVRHAELADSWPLRSAGSSIVGKRKELFPWQR